MWVQSTFNMSHMPAQLHHAQRSHVQPRSENDDWQQYNNGNIGPLNALCFQTNALMEADLRGGLLPVLGKKCLGLPGWKELTCPACPKSACSAGIWHMTSEMRRDPMSNNNTRMVARMLKEVHAGIRSSLGMHRQNHSVTAAGYAERGATAGIARYVSMATRLLAAGPAACKARGQALPGSLPARTPQPNLQVW